MDAPERHNQKRRARPPEPKRLTAAERALRMARTGLYADCGEVELAVGAFLDEHTRDQVNRLCIYART